MLDAKTPQAALKVESEDTRIDSRLVVCLWKSTKRAKSGRMIKDDRVQQKDYNSIFDVGQSADRLG